MPQSHDDLVTTTGITHHARHGLCPLDAGQQDINRELLKPTQGSNVGGEGSGHEDLTEHTVVILSEVPAKLSNS